MLENIIEKINNNEYQNKLTYPRKSEIMKDGYITDENKSVKWNKEQVIKNQKEYNNEMTLYQKENERLAKLFEEDVINYIKNEFNYNEKAAKFILSEAWERGHSYGLQQVINEVTDLVEFIYDFNSLNS